MDEKPKIQGAMSLKDLAQSRAKLYESIGKLKAELVTIDVAKETAETESSAEPMPIELPTLDDLAPNVNGENPMLAALREERDALRKAMKASDEALEESEEARADLLEEKVRLRRATEAANAERDEANKKREAVLAKLERAKTRTEAALQTQEKEKSKVKAQLMVVEDKLVSTIEQLKHRDTEVERLKDEIKYLKADLLEKVEKADGVQGTLESFQQKLSERDDIIRSLESEVEKGAALKSRLEALSTQNVELQAKLATSERNHSELEANIEDLQHRLKQEENLARGLGEAHAEMVVLKGELEKQRLKLDSLERERDKLVMLREAGKKRSESLEAEKQALHDELTRAAENLQEVKKLIKMIEETGI